MSSNFNPNPTLNKSKGMYFAIIAAITYAIPTIKSLFFSDSFTLSLSFIMQLLVIFALFRGKKDILPVIAFAYTPLVYLFNFISRQYSYTLVNTLIVLAYFFLYVIILIVCTNLLQNTKSIINVCWFVPSSLIIFAMLSAYLPFAFDLYFGIGSFGIYYEPSFYYFWIIEAISMFFTGLWLTDGISDSSPVVHRSNLQIGEYSTMTSQTSIKSNIYCSLVKHIFLLLFTFGIWNLIWIYRITEHLNYVKNEEYRNPTTKLLLCMFVPFYYIYWTYKSAQKVDKLAYDKSISSDITTLCLILSLFIPIIPPIIIQDKINTIETTSIKVESSITAPIVEKASPTNIDELKSYKELLDSGIITQEEFETKKKQILGL